MWELDKYFFRLKNRKIIQSVEIFFSIEKVVILYRDLESSLMLFISEIYLFYIEYFMKRNFVSALMYVWRYLVD